ncbi:hypothetical protein V6N13_009565 [Hibiscus sabdariffa]
MRNRSWSNKEGTPVEATVLQARKEKGLKQGLMQASALKKYRSLKQSVVKLTEKKQRVWTTKYETKIPKLQLVPQGPNREHVNLKNKIHLIELTGSLERRRNVPTSCSFISQDMGMQQKLVGDSK